MIRIVVRAGDTGGQRERCRGLRRARRAVRILVVDPLL
jgi:hypothetical protein